MSKFKVGDVVKRKNGEPFGDGNLYNTIRKPSLNEECESPNIVWVENGLIGVNQVELALKSLKDWDAKVGDVFVFHWGGSPEPSGPPRVITKVIGSDYYGNDMVVGSGGSKLSKEHLWSLVSRAKDVPVEQTTDKKPDGGPAQQELLEHFKYEDGELIRIKASTTRPDTLGQPFGGSTGTGYIQGWFKNKLYYLHHLIWIYHYGKLPEGIIDHINRDKTDNRIENLREASKQQNSWNRSGDTGAVSQFKGVSRKRDKWRARIVVDGVEHSLGVFETEIAAGLAYKQASRLLQGEYSID